MLCGSISNSSSVWKQNTKEKAIAQLGKISCGGSICAHNDYAHLSQYPKGVKYSYDQKPRWVQI